MLVGRDDEKKIVDGAIDALAAKRGRVVLLSGEPGIGKSSLARYAAEVATRNELPVYWGFAWESGGAPAYWPWTQILRPLIGELKPPASALDKLGQLLPESAREESATLNPQQAHFQLLEAVRSLLEGVCRQRPVVLVFEDLHAADSDTLNLLHYIGQHVASLPLLLIGTFRSAEARVLRSAESLWQTVRGASNIELTGLGRNAVRSYVARQGNTEPDDAQVDRLFETTQGNPLFLAELTLLLDSAPATNDLRLPKTVMQVIRRHLKLLPEQTDSLLSQASIIGRSFDPGVLATLAGESPGSVAASLEPAFDAGFLKHAHGGEYRFTHVLHRDVLYQALADADRSLMHLAYAELIRKDIADGIEDRWTELANHLDAAGVEHKPAAIEALRNAASRAIKRLAFEDAARLLGDALNAFGTGPKFKPGDRCTLLLECARATMLSGKIDAGQSLCREAFATARTLEDSALMASAALTWGSEFVIGKVDKSLIAALQESLERLPDDDVAHRARVQARLAAALQPAAKPAEPMGLAREAIQLARSAGDDDVLYDVLRSGISALMDFGPVSERLPLHHEFGSLARKIGDVPGRFRSSLRIMIDASIAGDRETMVGAIQDCDQLARRIDLPHYLWRAASARAMQAVLEGNFEHASRLIDEAEAHAGKINEVEAMITLPLQRFAILTEWEASDIGTLDAITRRLRETFGGGMEEAEFFVAPFILSYTSAGDPDVARRLISDPSMIERSFAADDCYLLIRVGELGVAGGDLQLVERTIAALEPKRQECATVGLMGSIWAGPVAYFLGTLSAAIGRIEAAAEYLESAFVLATRMQAMPYLARAHLAMADVESARGNRQAADTHAEKGLRICERLELRKVQGIPAGPSPAPVARQTALHIEQQGDVWKVGLGGTETVVRDSKGMHMLARLVQNAGQEIHVLDLSGSARGLESSDAGPALDREARKQYRQRIGALQEQIEEARELGDIAQADSVQAEMEFLAGELSRAFGLGGRERRSGNVAERARVNVRRRLKDAIRRIGEQDMHTGRYLENTIKTGLFCKYTPL